MFLQTNLKLNSLKFQEFYTKDMVSPKEKCLHADLLVLFILGF